MQEQTRLIRNCIALLEQAAVLLQRIDDQTYISPNRLSPGGSIGVHMRHCLDFYQSFLSGIDKARVDYNVRERGSLIETHRFSALQRIEATIVGLRFVPTDQPTFLLVSTENDATNRSSWCASSLLRELEFLQSHTIHHYSLVAMLLRLQGIEPGEDFGVAPSTLEYWREQAACAR